MTESDNRTAWLVEQKNASPPLWVKFSLRDDGQIVVQFTADALEATHFAREKDAADMLTVCPGANCEAKEHRFG